MAAAAMQSTSETGTCRAIAGVTLVPAPLTPEDQARADLYALIARLLLAPPDEALLADLAQADSLTSQQTGNPLANPLANPPANPPDYPLDLAWEKLILTAAIMDVCSIRDEFNALFVSIGTPQIDPYASLYLSGFMNEKPLAALRTELAHLGLARVPGVGVLEDHLAALCETMRLLITGDQGGTRQPLQRQWLFFEKHIASWYARCLHDIRSVKGVNFYLQVADFTQAFLSIEAQAFEMEEGCHGESR
jgi:TorA maturation chaperone TorD